MANWKMEVFKMGLYIYLPILTWYTFNTEFAQVNIVYPYLKKHNKALYRKLTLEEDDENL